MYKVSRSFKLAFLLHSKKTFTTKQIEVQLMLSDLLKITDGKRVLFITPSHVDYIRNRQEMIMEQQETIREQDGQIYALKSKIIELERQLESLRRPDPQRNGMETSPRRPYRLC